VLERAATEAHWNLPLEGDARRARGIALHSAFGSIIAQVAEVSITPENEIRVHRVVCAVDCGIAINPTIIEQQIESGVIFGLTAALYGGVDIMDGEVRQSNFHDSKLLRLHEAPKIETHIIDSNREPGGLGEPGLPPIAAAVANGVFVLTKQRIRHLPLTLQGTHPAPTTQFANVRAPAASDFAKTTVRFTVNGRDETVETAPDTPLLWALRQDVRGPLLGAKYACGAALCGACTVLVNGQPTRSCVKPCVTVAGERVTTIEGVFSDATFRHFADAVRKAWVDEDVVQCGYCQPGQVLAATALLKSTFPRAPSDVDIEQAMSGNACRCGTYPRIRRAIHAAAKSLTGSSTRS
jgi:isoquinoline 1-oxidoreductase beta subunit